MSLRFALLGLLAEAPMSGYDLTKRFEHSLSAIWPARHNQIYTELKKVLDAGLIEQVDYGPRNRKLYAITAAGNETVRAWLMEEPDVSDRALRFEPLLRGNFLWLLEPDQANTVLEREAIVFKERRSWLETQIQNLPDDDADGSIGARRQIAVLGMTIYGALADWLDDYRQRLNRQAQ